MALSAVRPSCAVCVFQCVWLTESLNKTDGCLSVCSALYRPAERSSSGRPRAGGLGAACLSICMFPSVSLSLETLVTAGVQKQPCSCSFVPAAGERSERDARGRVEWKVSTVVKLQVETSMVLKRPPSCYVDGARPCESLSPVSAQGDGRRNETQTFTFFHRRQLDFTQDPVPASACVLMSAVFTTFFFVDVVLCFQFRDSRQGRVIGQILLKLLQNSNTTAFDPLI